MSDERSELLAKAWKQAPPGENSGWDTFMEAFIAWEDTQPRMTSLHAAACWGWRRRDTRKEESDEG